MSRNTFLAPDEFYHLYNRGTDKREIFSTNADRERFVALLYLCNSIEPVRLDDIRKSQGSTLRNLLEIDQKETLIDIAAYCLMPNHFHLLVHEKTEGGTSKFMQKLTTGYTMYFNKRHERNGSLFQGKFKATHVSDNRYLKYLISYIHLNPVKLIDPLWKKSGIRDRAGAQKYLHEYPYSSYRDYLGEDRAESKILNKKVLPDYFENERDFEIEIEDWLSYKKEDEEV
ncbi:MAG: transposase [Minisyncoccota bacterium]